MISRPSESVIVRPTSPKPKIFARKSPFGCSFGPRPEEKLTFRNSSGMDGKPAIWQASTWEAKFRPHFGGAAEPHEQASVEVPSKGDLRSKKVDCDLLQRQRKVRWCQNMAAQSFPGTGPPHIPNAVLGEAAWWSSEQSEIRRAGWQNGHHSSCRTGGRYRHVTRGHLP